MGGKSARAYNRNQAKYLVNGLQRILDRINPEYTPRWMLRELYAANYRAQCIQYEFERVMEEHGDEKACPDI